MTTCPELSQFKELPTEKFIEEIENLGKTMVPNIDKEYCMYFDNVKNDQTIKNMISLINLKNIFSRQLPKMPKEYICKLIFDRKHEAIVIRKKTSKIIGGICFRVYEERKFAEIAFLAISAEEQIKGFGTKLMNQLKAEMQKRRINFLMTYADNLAIGYFKKQGFQKTILIPSEVWKGYLKDYDGSTHMECLINPNVDYSRLPKAIKRQREHVIKTILSLSNSDVLYSGLKAKSFRKNFDEKKENSIRIETIPGISKSTFTRREYEILRKRPRGTSFKASCKKIVQQLEKHKSAWPFQHPVKKVEVPDYYDIIKKPMDLTTLKDNIKNSKYKSKDAFQEDVMLIFKNAKTYNQKRTIYYKCAVELQEHAEKLLNNLKYDFDDTDEIEDQVVKKLKIN